MHEGTGQTQGHAGLLLSMEPAEFLSRVDSDASGATQLPFLALLGLGLNPGIASDQVEAPWAGYGSGGTTRTVGSIRPLLEGEVDPAWWEPVILQCEALLRLVEGWDSHGAKRTDPENVRDAVEWLKSVWTPTLPSPLIVPTPPGGVQFEWTGPRGDFECEFRGGHVEFLAEEQTGEEAEGRYALPDAAGTRRMTGMLVKLLRAE